jgi:transcriptional regulator with XRE-family HTH domain
MTTSTVADELKSLRASIGLSQSRLARLSGVSRFKICLFELGDGKLTSEELARIRIAFQREIERFRTLSSMVEFARPTATDSTKGGVAA